MEENFDKITEWLFEASARVPYDYVQLPVAGAESPIYRERVYCYELYHQWRRQWPDDYRFRLSGEVDKQRHPIVRSKAKPDFLVHVPGDMDNLLVMEVKPAYVPVPKLMPKIMKDLRTLSRFTSFPNGRYFVGILWIYGANIDFWQVAKRQLRRDVDLTEINLARIRVVLHETAGEKAHFVDWE